MENSTRSLRPGMVVHNRYKILSILGEGGCGVTYQAVDQKDGLVVALKECNPLGVVSRRPGEFFLQPQSGQEEYFNRFKDRFLEEARLIYRYREHPNVISVRHLFYENNTAYYAMEFIQGQDLREILRKEGPRLPWSRLKPMMGQAVAALETVHKSGIIHCDISPDNLFILKGGQLKLIDFGAAKSSIRKPGSMVFYKESYAPPEQFQENGNMGPWTDVYSLAVTMYLAYTGIMPPKAQDRLVNDTTKWPSSLGLPVPTPEWERVLQKAMALRIQDRYTDIRRFWNDLLSVSVKGAGGIWCIEGMSGYYNGKRIYIEEPMLLGVDQTQCQIFYPQQFSAGISRRHIRFWCEGNQLLVMDMGSTYGSYLNGEKMPPGLVYRLSPGMIIEIGNRQRFRMIYEK